MLFWFLYAIVIIPFSIIFPVKIFGKKNLKKYKNYVLVCNHQSNFDAVILDLKLRKRVRFIAKKELWKGKKRSFLFDTTLGCIPVDRQKGMTMDTTKKVLSLLKDNKTVGIFPEGTRHNSGVNEDMSVKNGACMFSLKTKTPILPCYIAKKQKAFSKNVLVVGEPFELSDFYDKKIDKEVLNLCSAILVEKMNALKQNYDKMVEEKELIKKLKKQQKNKN